MRVINETRGCILAERVEVATRAWARMRGLLGREGLELGSALVIEPCNSIHTFFMKFSIDVLFIDREGQVLGVYETLPPWRLTRLYSRANGVVELPAGSLAGTGTRIGDRILFVQQP